MFSKISKKSLLTEEKELNFLSPQPRRITSSRKKSSRGSSTESLKNFTKAVQLRSFESISPKTQFKPLTPIKKDVNSTLDLVNPVNSSKNEQTFSVNSSSCSELSIVEKDANNNNKELETIKQDLFCSSEFKDKDVYQVLDSITPCSRSSLELMLCLRTSEKMANRAITLFGPHKEGIDIFEAFRQFCLKNENLEYEDFLKIFTSENLSFYDYYYLRNIEKMIQEEFMEEK